MTVGPLLGQAFDENKDGKEGSGVRGQGSAGATVALEQEECHPF